MEQYRLVAFDMDGTLLDSHKHISWATQQAIRQAAEVVGDADNDIAAMKKAGLAVAMKNANKYHCILKKKMDHMKLKINCMAYTVSAVRTGRSEV